MLLRQYCTLGSMGPAISMQEEIAGPFIYVLWRLGRFAVVWHTHSVFKLRESAAEAEWRWCRREQEEHGVDRGCS